MSCRPQNGFGCERLPLVGLRGKHFAGVLTRGGGDFDTAQHARNFLNAFGSTEQLNSAENAASLTFAAHLQLLMGAGGDLRQMRDAKHLTT